MGAGAVGMATNSNAVGQTSPGVLSFVPLSIPSPGPLPEGEDPFSFFAPVPAGEPFRLCLPTEDVAFFPEEGAFFSDVFDGDLAPPWVFDAFGSPGGDGDDEATFFGVIAAR